MWVALFIFCNPFEGCMPVTFNDQRLFQTKEECEVYTEEKSDLVIATLEKYNAPGSIRYDCKQDDKPWT